MHRHVYLHIQKVSGEVCMYTQTYTHPTWCVTHLGSVGGEIYMYSVYMCVHIYTCVYMCMCVYMYVSPTVLKCTIHKYVCVYIYMCMYVCTYVYVVKVA